ncbi:MAG: hypothetical protein Q4F72_06945 [Desulfovibrionaceae bacterium]|nr:hypothetical protein [Desulfovibrionaceae bacterium]
MRPHFCLACRLAVAALLLVSLCACSTVQVKAQGQVVTGVSVGSR